MVIVASGARLASRMVKRAIAAAFIQEAFAFEDRQQAFRRAEFLEDGDDGGRVGGGNGRAEEEAGDQRQIGHGEKRSAHQQGRRDYRDHGHEHHHGDIFQQPAHIDR